MDKPTTAFFVSALLKGKEVIRNRAEARKFLRGRGPHLPLVVQPPRISKRRVTTRQKRAEQRRRAGG